MFKHKYVISYQHGGEWTDFKDKSNCEVKKYLFNLENNISDSKPDCPNSYYNYTNFDTELIERKCKLHEPVCAENGHTDVKTDGKSCLDCLKDIKLRTKISDPEEKKIINGLSNRYTINYEIIKNCQKINELENYFKQSLNASFNTAQNIENTNDAYYYNYDDDDDDDDKKYIKNNILLDISKYLNSPVNNSLISDKHLICLEGNLVYVDNLCRVASGNINTCIFFTLEFNDNSSISFHINGGLSNNYINSNYISKAISFPVEPTNIFTYLKVNFCEILSKLTKIYIVGILDTYYLDKESNGIIWDPLKKANTLDKMNKQDILYIMQSKLGINHVENIELIKMHNKKNGNYIYANNNMYTMA